jgi:hypothetical protein
MRRWRLYVSVLVAATALAVGLLAIPGASPGGAPAATAAVPAAAVPTVFASSRATPPLNR